MANPSSDIRAIDIRAYLSNRGIPYSDHNHKNVAYGWISITCLFCSDTSNHLGINLESNTISCWKCNVTGTVIKLIMKIERCSFSDAILASRNFTHTLTSINQNGYLIPKIYTQDFNFQSVSQSSSEALQIHTDFLKQRRYDPETVTKKYKLHFCGPAHRKYPSKLVIPYLLNYKPVTFQVRDCTGLAESPYKACPKNKSIVQVKHTLYNIDNARKDTVIVVEGIFDTWRIGDGAVATSGTKYTSDQVLMLRNFRRVFVIFDDEPEAENLGRSLCKELSAAGVEHTEQVMLDGGKDPDDLSEQDVKCLKKELLGSIF